MISMSAFLSRSGFVSASRNRPDLIDSARLKAVVTAAIVFGWASSVRACKSVGSALSLATAVSACMHAAVSVTPIDGIAERMLGIIFGPSDASFSTIARVADESGSPADLSSASKRSLRIAVKNFTRQLCHKQLVCRCHSSLMFWALCLPV